MATFDFALLHLGHVHHDREWNFGPICSSFTRLYWVDEGEAEVTFDGRRHVLTAGHLYLIPALTSHYDHCDTSFHHYYLHFVDRTKHIIDYYQQYDMPFQLDVRATDEQAILRLLQLCPDMTLPSARPDTYDTSVGILEAARRFKSRPFALRMEAGGLLMQLLSRFFVKASARLQANDDRIIRTLYTIEKRLADTPPIERLAADISLSKDAFIRLFRRQTGRTPTDYIIHQRIHHAQMLFVDGHRSVKEVALSVGYDNISYFSRMFKKVTDVSPMEFIRQNR